MVSINQCRLYVSRRILFATLVFFEHTVDTVFFVTDRASPGTTSEGQHQVVSFLIHCKYR